MKTEDEKGYLFITGFTGFLGERLVTELLERRPAENIYALVRQSALGKARRQVETLEQKKPATRDRIQLLPGDITLSGLGLKTPDEMISRINEIFHLAALYDLTCPPSTAEKNNVEGTRNILGFAARCPHLRRHHYVSTCYVAGNHRGDFSEDDLDVGQGFFNNYERSKFAAEKLVRQSVDEIPTTIYRPGIVVGDSQSGEIDKFDGPYFVMNAMCKLPRYCAFFRIGSGKAPANIVPVDFVVRSLAHLSELDESQGQCYHLTDPTPHTVMETQRALITALDRRLLLVPTPLFLARILLQPRFIQNYLGLPVQTLPYFSHPLHFDTSRTRMHLAPSGITCPDLLDYLPRLVHFWRQRRSA